MLCSLAIKLEIGPKVGNITQTYFCTYGHSLALDPKFVYLNNRWISRADFKSRPEVAFQRESYLLLYE